MGRKKRPDDKWQPCTTEGCPNVASVKGFCRTCDSAHRKGMSRVPVTLIGTTPSGFGVLGQMSRTDDQVMCHECGRWFKSLSSHINRVHGLTAHDYRQRHQIAGTDPLMGTALVNKIAAEAKERVGGEAWKRFEKRRDEALPVSRLLATEASKSSTLAAKARTAANRKRSWGRACRDCGQPVPPPPQGGLRNARILCADCNGYADD